MDRQGFVSLYHDDAGLIIGGGNSKDQPAWSNFIIGDHSLPTGAGLVSGGVDLEYPPGTCSIMFEHDGDQAILMLSADLPSGCEDVQCRLPVHIVPGQTLRTGDGQALVVDGRRIKVMGKDVQWIGGDGWRIDLPLDATFEYPVFPFNPYAKDGKAPLEEASGFVHAPLSESAPQQVFRIETR